MLKLYCFLDPGTFHLCISLVFHSYVKKGKRKFKKMPQIRQLETAKSLLPHLCCDQEDKIWLPWFLLSTLLGKIKPVDYAVILPSANSSFLVKRMFLSEVIFSFWLLRSLNFPHSL